jgi:hypothetical protein
MSLRSNQQLEASRKKLTGLKELYEKTKADDSQTGYSRELTLRSIRKTINQFKEEIARYEAELAETSANS